MAALLFEAKEYLFKFDLKSGYHHVDIHPNYHTYLVDLFGRGVPILIIGYRIGRY